MKILDEFKTFIARGNVLDMAVGVVMGSAFTKIIGSLVENIITPVISVIVGKVDVSGLAVTVTDELTLPYGLFLQAVIDFLLTAVAVFALVKGMNRMKDRFEKKKEEEAEEEEEAKISDEAALLTEIRDLLKKQ